MQTIPHGWLLDVDGVITDPITKTVTEPNLISRLAKIISRDEIVALNTGRSLSWLNQRVVNPLFKHLHSEEFDRLYVIGEKGGSWLSIEKAEMAVIFDKSLSLPLKFRQIVAEMVKDDFSDLMFFDDSKKIIVTVEMRDGVNLVHFSQKQKQLVNRLQSLLIFHELDQQFKIDATRIATDIEHVKAGKAFGVGRLLSLINDRGFSVERFTAVGDSLSDLEMGKELVDRSIPVDFIYVGHSNEIDSTKYAFPVRVSRSTYQAGLMEFL
jgi:hypothetical protein